MRVTQVVADRVHQQVTEIHLPASVPYLQFEYQGLSLRIPAREMVYRYRLQGYDEDWQAPTRERRVRYPQLPVGTYTFQVQAVDRDLNYSAPAAVRLAVEPDPHLEGLSRALSPGGDEFVGESAALRRLQAQLQEIAPAAETVLILGETGTGKGLAARTVHELSPRQVGPFLQLTCGAFHEQLIESELFGHEKGSFTGAHARQLGRVELAAGGTLFLDEIGDLPLSLQAKLLRLLEERTFERLGGPQTLTAAVRIVAATNRQLERMVAEGSFRQDLLYRLKGFPVRLPPLRERQEDIPALVAHFLTRMAAHLHKPVEGVDSEALARLKHYAWPGNVRELKNVIERAVIVCAGPAVQAADLALGDEDEGPAAGPWPTLVEHERQYLRRVLRQTGGVIKGPQGAAAILGLHPATLHSRLKKLGVSRDGGAD